jgi:hypothetical protein
MLRFQIEASSPMAGRFLWLSVDRGIQLNTRVQRSQSSREKVVRLGADVAGRHIDNVVCVKDRVSDFTF